MTSRRSNEDVHFYVDNASPREVCAVLRVLSKTTLLTPKEIAQLAKDYYGFLIQKNVTYSPRRLFDLGLAERLNEGGMIKYCLTDTGMKIQSMMSFQPEMVMDILHFLHYTSFRGRPSDRKMFWSYRRCCQILWERGTVLPASEVAPMIQSEMVSTFPHLDFQASKGMRFNATAVTSIYSWFRALTPCPVGLPGTMILPRNVPNPKLVLLALESVFEQNGFRHGEPVFLDQEFIRLVSGVFFLDSHCFMELLSPLTRRQGLRISETLAGPCITLLKPIGIESI